MAMKSLYQPNYQTDGIEVLSDPSITNPAFKEIQERAYAGFTPARNASNTLCRGIRYGIWGPQSAEWLDKNTYSLSADLNPQEAGRVREMDLIPNDLLQTDTIKNLINRTAAVFHPSMDLKMEAYMIQLTAIRYQPTLDSFCEPSPPYPHQDQFNSAIWVVNKTAGIEGGQTRIYSIEGQPLWETNLGVGEGIAVKDSDYLHQVTTMNVNTEELETPEQSVCRDILIVRVDAMDR